MCATSISSAGVSPRSSQSLSLSSGNLVRVVGAATAAVRDSPHDGASTIILSLPYCVPQLLHVEGALKSPDAHDDAPRSSIAPPAPTFSDP